MSILIKGTKMPIECEYCMFAGFGGAANEYYVCMFNGKWKDRDSHGRMDSCPLVEIPPHGDLIDKNALMESIKENYCTPCPHDGDYNYCKACSIDDALDAIDDTPTVIESEEQEHGDGTTQD